MTEKISTRCWNQNQSWNFESTHKNRGHKLRVSIRRNAHDFQSSAYVERWDGTKWQKVCSKPITECKCEKVSYVQNDVSAKDFKQDEHNLLQEALAIVL